MGNSKSTQNKAIIDQKVDDITTPIRPTKPTNNDEYCSAEYVKQCLVKVDNDFRGLEKYYIDPNDNTVFSETYKPKKLPEGGTLCVYDGTQIKIVTEDYVIKHIRERFEVYKKSIIDQYDKVRDDFVKIFGTYKVNKTD